jgi:hypothetical protein
MKVDDRNPGIIFPACAEAVQTLYPLLKTLEQQAALLQIPELAGREWFEVLRQKLVPQLGDDSFLVVAVVGGTNIGKSVIFNHLAGCRASASSPMASGTKHPVCLVPEGFSQSHDLQAVFPDFELSEWSDAAMALQESDGHRLFWRTASELPSTLLILDTPDIDSDARVNWVRADAVRRSADVLVAVLTQQKYNDAAVKEFFRKAGDEDKAVLVIFNQCLLPEDEPYWPLWLETFCRETQIHPEAVYLAPNDRRAAEELRLPFFERIIQTDGVNITVAGDPSSSPRSLSADLARLKFHDIRMRTLLGSLRELVHPQRGLPGYLRQMQTASEDLARSSARLASESVVQIRDWPAAPNVALVSEIRQWWQTRQEGWARRINSLYNTVGQGLLWPIRTARNAIQGEPLLPMQDYRQREWMAILTVIEELFEKLQWMAESGHQIIRPRMETLLAGESRSALLQLLKQKHDEVDFDAELRIIVDEQMSLLEKSRPDVFGMYRQLNNVSAAVRPVTSIVLFSMGFGPAGELVAPMLGHAAASAVVHVVADVAGGATAAIAGEAAVSSAAGSGAGMLQAWFHSLHSAFTTRRAAWLTDLIHTKLLGRLPEELRDAAQLADSDAFKNVRRSVNQLETLLASAGR